MLSRTLTLSAVALAFSLAVGCSGSKSGLAPGGANRAQRAEIEAIVHDYLMEHPEIIPAAMKALQEREKKEAYAKTLGNPNDPAIGPSNAAVTIVEFFDYNCTYCRAAADWVFRQADDKRHDVRIVFKELPLLEGRTHSSVRAAKAALAAQRQGKYREMHLALLHSQDLSPEGIDKIAKGLGLDLDRLKKDMADASLDKQLNANYELFDKAGGEGTPGFFINGEFLSGYSEEQLAKMIEKARSKS